MGPGALRRCERLRRRVTREGPPPKAPSSSARSATCAPARASRDIFDARELLRPGTLDRTRLRLGFVVYGGANPVDWRTVTASAVRLTTKDVEERLLPLLRGDLVPDRRDIPAWTDALVRDCQELLGIVLPLTENERAFLDGVNDRGEIFPALLTDDERLRSIIASHPALAWKALNVRKHHGLPG